MTKTSVRTYFEGAIIEMNAEQKKPRSEHSVNHRDWYAETLQGILDGVDGEIQLSEGEIALLEGALDQLFGCYSDDPEEMKEWGLGMLQIATFIKLCA